MYSQKLSRFWWTQNPRYLLYFLRELTGVGISIYFLYIILIGTEKIPTPVHWIGFLSAIFHSITWLWVTVKISPIPLPKPIQIIGFILLIGLVFGISYLLLPIMYVRIS